MKKIDLVNKKINHLTVLECVGHQGKKVLWKCQCECGKYIYATTNAITGNHTVSCGCWKYKLLQNRNIKHNQSRTKLYNVWIAIKKRCNNVSDRYYKNYGARGIKVCEDWEHDYTAFYQWAINNGYKEGLSIDRIDNNKNYEPNNCRWVDITTQANNRSTNRYITINGNTMTLANWCRFYKVNYSMVISRINKNWEPLKALTTPALKRKKK